MIRRSATGAALAALCALAGCGAPPAENAVAPVEGGSAGVAPAPAPDPVETAPAAANDAAAEAPAASANLTEPAPMADAAAQSIPETVRGRWGLVPADCEPGRDDAKGLLTITADTLRFYESRAALGKVVERDASRIVADFAFSGEGQNWSLREVLDVQDGGRTLIRRESGADAMPGVLRYRRCA